MVEEWKLPGLRKRVYYQSKSMIVKSTNHRTKEDLSLLGYICGGLHSEGINVNDCIQRKKFFAGILKMHQQL